MLTRHSQRSTLNAQSFFILIVALAAALSLAAQQRIYFRDKAGNMELTNFTSWKISRVEGTEGTYKFRAAGKPLTAKWETQGFTARTANIQGTANQGDQGLELVDATMTGGVNATALRQATGGRQQTVVIESDSLEFDGPKNQVDLKGGVSVDQTESGTSNAVKATGSGGTVVLTPRTGASAKGPVQSMVLSGPARIELVSTRVITERRGDQRVRTTKPVRIVATSSRVEFRLSEGSDYGKFTLIGSVVIEGNDPLLVGEMRGVDRVVITLDKNRQPSDIEAFGEPTRTTVRKAGGTAGTR